MKATSSSPSKGVSYSRNASGQDAPGSIESAVDVQRPPSSSHDSRAPDQEHSNLDGPNTASQGADMDEGDGVDDPASQPLPIPSMLTYRLYTSHFLSTWNSRLFEFGATLFLASIFPNTLLPMSVYALARSAAAIVLSPAVGSWIDSGNRLNVVRVSIIGQRLAVAASCGIFWVLEDKSLVLRIGQANKKVLFAISVVLACVEKLCSVMNLVSVERDWVVVITEGNQMARQGLNARLRRIDLVCKLVGPLIISLINGVSVLVAVWVTLGMSSISVAFEYFLIARVYHLVPGLKHHSPIPQEDEVNREPADASTPLVGRRSIPFTSRLKSFGVATINRVLPLRFVPFYFAHSSFLPSMALSLLYLTVLSFGGQMATFLLFTGYSSIHVGIARTVSTIVELSATWAAPRVAKKIGVTRGGIWFLSWQMVWLAAGVAFFFSQGRGQGSKSIVAVSGLVVGVVLSRVGLWGFDLCAQNIIQDTVEFSHRGAFSTVEAAFQNLFELLSFASTIVFSRPDQFQWPIVISVVATYVAGGLFAIYVRKKRGHLVHAPSCIPQRYII